MAECSRVVSMAVNCRSGKIGGFLTLLIQMKSLNY